VAKAIAVNGSPNGTKGYTNLILTPFLEGIKDAGFEIEQFNTNSLDIKPCSCGNMQCWYGTPGICCFQDDMSNLYDTLKLAELLIIATPVYIPLPGDMQNFLNRLCPLVVPRLDFTSGRTCAQFRKEVKIKKIILVSAGAWWEIQNFDNVVRIVQELAEKADVEFGGAILRPHAFLMKNDGKLTGEGERILNLVRKAGCAIIEDGVMDSQLLEKISQPLISEEDLRQMYNKFI